MYKLSEMYRRETVSVTSSHEANGKTLPALIVLMIESSGMLVKKLAMLVAFPTF